MMNLYIISACLAGVNCKYNGGNNIDDRIVKLVKQGKAVLVCPEQLGGLTTPRRPSEIKNDKDGQMRVINDRDEDVTGEIIKGAEETLNIAKLFNSKIAILKSGSPSCGYGWIYDGSFTKRKIKGNGITADILLKNGIKVYNEDNFPEEIQ